MIIDNEVTLIKKINSFYEEQLKKETNFNIDLELDFFSRYEKEKENLIDLDIINGNEIDHVRYGVWRKFKRKDSIDNLTYTDIRKLSVDFKSLDIDMKQILYSNGLKKEIPREYMFDNYDELQLYSMVLILGPKGYNFLRGLIDSNIKLNESNGDVIVNGNIIGTIKIDNLPGKFFKYLLNNKGNYKSHEDIISEINPGNRSKTYSTQCSELKSELPPPIKKLIESKKGHYIIK